MPRGGGFFSRIGNAISRVGDFFRETFTGPTQEKPPPREPSRPRREPSRRRREPPPRQPPSRASRDRQRARERDPYLFWYDRETRTTPWAGSYLEHRDFFASWADRYDLTPEEREEMWRDYLHYMVAGKGPYLRKDVRNPFWSKWGINPDRWNWKGWREVQGDSPIKK